MTLCVQAPGEGIFVNGVLSHITSPAMKISKDVDHETGAGCLQKEKQKL